MGDKALVENQIADSIKLIQELDSDNRAPGLAAWYYYDDADEWRLLIAGSTFDTLLPKHEDVAYKYLVETMASLALSSLAISDLKLVRTNSPLPQALRFLVRTKSDGIVQVRFANTTLNGIFIKDMVILRSA